MTLVYVGLFMMILGTLKTLLTSEFRMKLHFIGISDVVGVVLVTIGLMMKGFEIEKLAVGLIFTIVWIPLITHALARAYISRLRR